MPREVHVSWRDIQLTAHGLSCELGSLDDSQAELVREGVHDSRTGRLTWMFRANLDGDQAERVRRFRFMVGKETRVRLVTGLPERFRPYERLQLDGCRLTLDDSELRLEDPETADHQSWMWKPE